MASAGVALNLWLRLFFRSRETLGEPLALRVYRSRNGKATFEREGRELPVNMYYKKILAHYTCSNKIKSFCYSSFLVEVAFWSGVDEIGSSRLLVMSL